MKFSILSALAIAMAGTASAVPGFVTNLARASTEIKSSSALGGRVEIKIDGVSANFLSPQCLSVLEDAFGTAYQQMYGNDSMVGTVVAGSAVVEDDGNRKAADDHLRDHYVYPGYRHWIVFDYVSIIHPADVTPTTMSTRFISHIFLRSNSPPSLATT